MKLTGAREVLRRSPVARAGVISVALLVVAEGAVLLLAPADEGPPPEPAAAGDYFSETQVERAEDYRHGQLLLALAGLGAQALAVGFLAVGRPRSLNRFLRRLDGHPVAGAAAAGLVVVAVAELAALPASVAAHERSVDAGLSTQSLGPWLEDRALGFAITGAIAAGGATALSALARRFQRGWWLPAAGVAVGFGAAAALLGPVVVAPLFNDFDPLEKGELRSEVIDLGRRADIEIGEVYRVDASRRSTALNAYVAGLGPTKRVVLYDTLIEDADRAELRSVVAHELAHVAHADIRRGIMFAALVSPLGFLLVRELTEALAHRTGAAPGSPGAIPAMFLAIGLVGFALNVAGNQLSRKVERSADAFAIELTGEPEALIDLQVRLAKRNLSDPDPPEAARVLFGTHPTTLERIGAARAQGGAGTAP